MEIYKRYIYHIIYQVLNIIVTSLFQDVVNTCFLTSYAALIYLAPP